MIQWMGLYNAVFCVPGLFVVLNMIIDASTKYCLFMCSDWFWHHPSSSVFYDQNQDGIGKTWYNELASVSPIASVKKDGRVTQKSRNRC